MFRFRATALALSFLPSIYAALDPATPLPGETTYFRAPDMADPAVSPDGKNVAFIANQAGHARLYRLDLATGAPTGIFDPGEGEVTHYWWLDGQHVIIAGLGQSGRQYFVQSILTGPPREVTTLQGVPPDWVHLIPTDPNHIVVIKWGHVSRWPYATRIDVNIDKGDPIDREVRNISSAVISNNGEVRAKAYREGDRWHLLYRAAGSSPWQQLDTVGSLPPFWPVAMAMDDRHIIVLAYDQGNTTALMEMDPATGARTLLAQRPDRDIFRIINSGQNRRIIGVSFFSPGQDDAKFFDDNVGAILARIRNSLPESHLRIRNTSLDGAVQIVQAWNPGQPAAYYLLEPARGRLAKIGQQYTAETLPVLGAVRFFKFTTRDGQAESGYILEPPAARGKRPYPALLFPIDFVGQEGDLSLQYNPLEQFLASRGVAVIRMMVRGSRGLGKAFLEAGEFKLADTVTHDYEDGLAALTQQGLVDPRRIAIFGQGRSALLALRMASVSTMFKAVITRDAQGANIGSGDIDWLTGNYASEERMLSQAGGRSAAASLIGQFDPARFINDLHAHALVIYTSDYDREYYVSDAGHLRGALQKHGKPHEWFFFDLHERDRRTDAYYDAVLANKMADYLDQQFGTVQ